MMPQQTLWDGCSISPWRPILTSRPRGALSTIMPRRPDGTHIAFEHALPLTDPAVHYSNMEYGNALRSFPPCTSVGRGINVGSSFRVHRNRRQL